MTEWAELALCVQSLLGMAKRALNRRGRFSMSGVCYSSRPTAERI